MFDQDSGPYQMLSAAFTSTQPFLTVSQLYFNENICISAWKGENHQNTYYIRIKYVPDPYPNPYPYKGRVFAYKGRIFPY